MERIARRGFFKKTCTCRSPSWGGKESPPLLAFFPAEFFFRTMDVRSALMLTHTHWVLVKTNPGHRRLDRRAGARRPVTHAGH